MPSNSLDDCIDRSIIEILNIFDPELQLVNTESMIKNKLKEPLTELNKFKVQTILVFDYKKISDRKIFYVLLN